LRINSIFYTYGGKMRLGIDIGGTFVKMALYDSAFEIIAKSSEAFIRDGNQQINSVKRIIKQADNILEDREGVLESIGISVPGSVSVERGVVIDAYNLDFHNLPLRDLFEMHFPLKVHVANDADAAAVAEWKMGALKGCDYAMLATLGTGLGVGLILHGELFTGGRGNGSEGGHIFLRAGGRKCSCGNEGCAESYCTATRLCTDGHTTSAKEVFEREAGGDEEAGRLVDAYIDDLGSYLATMVNLLDLQRIAIGGGVCNAGDRLMIPLQKNVEKKCFFPTCPPIVRAHFGNDAGTLGAALLG
jgi:glucokinase